MASPHGGSQRDLKVLIIGKAGSGKSTLGNLILRRTAFGTQHGMEMKTKDHKSELEYYSRLRRHIRVVDTPDIECFSNNQEVERENIEVWKAATEQAPDAILYTIRCNDTYDGPTHEKYKKIKKLWGQGFCDKLIVAFTFKDNKNSDIQTEIANAGRDLKEVVDDADKRYLEFSSKYPQEEQVSNLLRLMMQMERSSPSGAALPRTPSRMDTSHTNNDIKLSVVIIGKTKTGKTKIASAIVGKQLNSGNYDTKYNAEQTTEQIGSTKITVVDTPDLIQSRLDEKKQVSEWKELAGSKPDVILLAVPLDKRYTERDLELYQKIKTNWGQDDFKHRFAVVFTSGDRTQADRFKMQEHAFNEVRTDVNQRYVFLEDMTAQFGNYTGVVHFMVKIIEELFSFAILANETTMHSRSGRSAIDVHYSSYDSTAHRQQSHRQQYGSSSAMTIPTVRSPRKDLSILVIGKAGTGKSSLANAILQKPEFDVAVGMTIQTKTAAKGSGSLGDMICKVVDTPDISNLRGNKDAEIKKWSKLTHPGPDITVLTVRCDSKYTPEDFAMYQELQQLGMGSVLKQNLLVVFTFGDQRQPDFEEDVRGGGFSLDSILKDAAGRIIYNDKWMASDKAAFVKKLLDMARPGIY